MTTKPPAKPSKRSIKAKQRYAKSRNELEQQRRVEEFVALRLKGHSYQEIAEITGYYSGENVHRAMWRFLGRQRERLAEDLESIRNLEVSRLDKVLKAAYNIATDPKGKKSDVLKATEVVLKIQDRRARLLGLDAPTKYAHAMFVGNGDDDPKAVFMAMARSLVEAGEDPIGLLSAGGIMRQLAPAVELEAELIEEEQSE